MSKKARKINLKCVTPSANPHKTALYRVSIEVSPPLPFFVYAPFQSLKPRKPEREPNRCAICKESAAPCP